MEQAKKRKKIMLISPMLHQGGFERICVMTARLLQKEYDVVIGPVANDQAIRTVNNYLRGYFPEDVAIRLLLPQKLKDQYAFRTEKSINLLKFTEARNV